MAPVTDPEPVDDVPDATSRTPLTLPVSPVGADRLRPAVLGTAALAAVLVAAAALIGYAATLGLALVLALVLAISWPSVGGSVTPAQTSLILAFSGVLIVVSSLREDLLWTAAAVAAGIVLSFLHQLMRRPPRPGLVLTLLASFGGLVLIASVTTMAGLAHVPSLKGFVVVAMVAVVAGLLGDLLVVARAVRPFLSMVALIAAVAGALLAAAWFDGVSALDAASLGAAAGALSWSFRRVLSGQAAILGARGQVASGLGSVLVVGAVVHLLAVIA